MKADEVLNWFGLITLVLGSLSLSIIGLRRSAWFGTQRSLFSSWDTIDIKLAKVAGIMFGIAIIVFVLAVIF